MTGMIPATIAAMPRRSTVLAAKAVLLNGLVLAAGFCSIAAVLLLSLSVMVGPQARGHRAALITETVLGMAGMAVAATTAGFGIAMGLLSVLLSGIVAGCFVTTTRRPRTPTLTQPQSHPGLISSGWRPS